MDAGELVTLRAEIKELKVQRDELRQLSRYHEADAAKLKEEGKELRSRVEELTKVTQTQRAEVTRYKQEAGLAQGLVEGLTARLVKSQDGEKSSVASVRRLVDETRRIKQESVRVKRVIEEAIGRIKELEKGELSLRTDVLELQGKLKQAEEKSTNELRKAVALKEVLKREKKRAEEFETRNRRLRLKAMQRPPPPSLPDDDSHAETEEEEMFPFMRRRSSHRTVRPRINDSEEDSEPPVSPNARSKRAAPPSPHSAGTVKRVKV